MTTDTPGDRPRLYIDANVFIDAYETTSPLADAARRIFESSEKGGLSIVSSSLTLHELLVKPLAMRHDALADAYRAMFSEPSEAMIVPAIDQDILERAAAVRAERSAVKLADSIHIATALATNCTCLVSDDRRLSLATNIAHLSVSAAASSDLLSS
jgi:predicted nucleic acid-binding protein